MIIKAIFHETFLYIKIKYRFEVTESTDEFLSYSLDTDDLNIDELNITEKDRYIKDELQQPTGTFFYFVFYYCIIGAIHI